MFTIPTDPDVMPTNKVKTAMRALGLDTTSSSEMSSILSTLDGDKTGLVEWEMFLQVMALKLVHDEESGDEASERRKREIQRVARVLGEDCSEEDLQEMIDEAAGTRAGQVYMKDFEQVMQRAGVL
jgi:Ca2+-binding EF-hand superfamily protein